MNIRDAIYARRSIRKYEDRPVEREKLVELCRLAAAAPSAVNRCPWEFVVVDAPEGMAALRATMRFGKFHAPAAIVVCGNTERFLPGDARDYWLEDTAAAMENLLLGALDLELGACWLGCAPQPDNIRKVSALLRLPKHLVPMGVAYVGYPAETPEPRTQFLETTLHWQDARADRA